MKILKPKTSDNLWCEWWTNVQEGWNEKKWSENETKKKNGERNETRIETVTT